MFIAPAVIDSGAVRTGGLEQLGTLKVHEAEARRCSFIFSP